MNVGSAFYCSLSFGTYDGGCMASFRHTIPAVRQGAEANGYCSLPGRQGILTSYNGGFMSLDQIARLLRIAWRGLDLVIRIIKFCSKL